jgi:hypothetical protein
MKLLTLTISLFAFLSFGQEQDSTSCDTIKILFNDWLVKPPKNTFALSFSPLLIGVTVAAEYNALLKSHKGNKLYRYGSKGRYFNTSLDYNYYDYVANDIAKIDLIETFDSVAVVRSNFSVTEQSNIRIGTIWLDRWISGVNLRHFYRGMHGLVGYKSEREGYTPELVEMTEGVSESYLNTVSLNSSGARRINYLNLGFGGVIGLDWIVPFDYDVEVEGLKGFSFGLYMSAAIGVQVKLWEQTTEDTDLIYEGQPVDRVTGTGWYTVGFKVGFLF